MIDVPGDGPELPAQSVPHDRAPDAPGDGEGQPRGVTGITLGDDERDGTPTNPAG